MNLKKASLYVAIVAALSTPHTIQAEETESIEKIVVTGSLIKRADLEGSSPVTVFDKDMIEKSGAQNMIDIANNLTINSGSRFTNENVALSGTSQFNIRGLGPGSTLTLINGRRAGIAPAATNLGNQFFDINQLPIAMIERIDFLTDGASSTYGSQAVAGVANIITRQGFEGLELSGRYQSSSNDAYDINLVAGAASDKGSVNIYATVTGQSVNYRSDFDFINARVGGNGDPSASKFLSSTGSPGSYYLADTSGAEIVTSGAAIADPNCEAAGGILKSGSCRLSFIDQLAIIPDENRLQVFSEFEYDVTDKVRAYGEFSFSRNKVQAILGAPFYSNGLAQWGRMYIPGDHPFNFFVENDTNDGLTYIGAENWDSSIHQGADLVGKSRPFGYSTTGDSPSGLNNHIDMEYNYHRVVTGAEIELSDTWTIDTSYVYAVGTKESTTRLGLSKTTFNDALLAGAFNPFGSAHSNPTLVSPKDGTSVAGNSTQALANVIHDLTSNTDSEQQVVEAIASGELFDIDSGTVSLAVGTQYRYEKYTYTPDSLSAKGLGLGSTPDASIDGETNVYAIFSELLIPVSENIELQTALRYEDYDTVGSTLDPKVAVLWSINDELTLRSSYGTSFQAPTNLQTGTTSGAQFITDSVTYESGVGVCGAGDSNLVFLTTKGTDDLEPSKAKNWNLGLVYQPTDNFMIKADLWSFKYEDLIAQDSSATGIVNNLCDGIAEGGTPRVDDRIIRSGEGQLREITLNYVNTGSVETSGLDISVNYDLDIADYGNMSFGLDSTYVNKFDIVAFDGDDVVDGAGSYNSANAFKAMPELRANFRVSWNLGNHAIYTSARYISSYDNDLTSEENDEIASHTTIDVKYSYSFASQNYGETSLSVGANNLFDQAPPSLGENVRPGYDATTHDIRGRVLFVSFKQSF
ncbi:MAG: TonB-dependent receptor [Colwellia sp.]|nr:TonB-dependent receptor [Colwellia sp.]